MRRWLVLFLIGALVAGAVGCGARVDPVAGPPPGRSEAVSSATVRPPAPTRSSASSPPVVIPAATSAPLVPTEPVTTDMALPTAAAVTTTHDWITGGTNVVNGPSRQVGPTMPPPPPTTTTTTTTTTAPAGPATVVWKGTTDRPVVAFTFDAGSDAGSASAILEWLSANRIAATFFLTGKWADAYPTIAARMAREGHRVGNHSYSHPSFTGYSTKTAHLSTAEMVDQLTRAEAAISSRTGRSTKPLFRPPYGDQDAWVNQVVGANGYAYDIMWTVDSLGWKGTPPDQVITRVVNAAVPGAILMFHVGTGSTDLAALPGILAGLQAKGLGVVLLESILP